MSNLEVSAKSWRPQILTLFPEPIISKNLAYFSHALNQGRGFLTFGANVQPTQNVAKIYENLKQDLKGYKIPSHLHLNACASSYFGHAQIVRNYGFGLLKPNTVLLSASSNYFDEESFVQLLFDIHGQHKNIVLLKDDPLKDYLFADSSRKNKTINLWWRGKYPGNFEFCLALAYLLQQSSQWPKAKICIKMVAKDETTKDKLFAQFEKYKPELRIKELEFMPLIDPEERFFANFESHSQGADLTFLGLRSPEEGSSPSQYAAYYQNLLDRTRHVNNIAYILCGEKVEFKKIFQA